MFPTQIEKFINYNNSFKEEIKATTDRACVIVAVAYLDDLLRDILAAYMTKSNDRETKEMFEGANAPFSSFSSKIKTTFRLGLISVWEYNTLESIRKIRNKFAHLVCINSLDNTEIKDIIQNIKPNRKWLHPKEKLDKSNNEITIYIPIINENSCRDIFEKSVDYLIDNLLFRAEVAGYNKRKQAKNITSSIEILQKFASLSNSLVKTQLKSLKELCSISDRIDKIVKDCLTNKDKLLSSGKSLECKEIKKLIDDISKLQVEKDNTEKLKLDLENQIQENITQQKFFDYLKKETIKLLKTENLY